MNYDEIGRRVRRLRKAHGLSQEALAEKIHISTVHMSHIETASTKLSLPVLVDLAAALGVPTDELLRENASAGRSAPVEEIDRLLESCTTEQVKILADILKAAKTALDKYV